MYKRQVNQIVFPAGTNILPRVFFSIKNFIWLPHPLNKGKLDFYCISELTEAFTTILHQKTSRNPPKKPIEIELDDGSWDTVRPLFKRKMRQKGSYYDKTERNVFKQYFTTIRQIVHNILQLSGK